MPRPPSTKDLADIRRRLARWSRTSLRDFTWRRGALSPFHALVTEALLARTRAEAVDGIAAGLYARFPGPAALAEAETAELEAVVRPLGLFRKRAAQLKGLGLALVARGGEVPGTFEELVELPGVGAYAASAYLAFFTGARRSVVDANVARVLERRLGVARTTDRVQEDPHLAGIVARLLPRGDRRVFLWGLLDLGGTVCTARAPRCDACPLRTGCRARPGERSTPARRRSGDASPV